jgi:threonine dehydrogenase-like Zn-dependent dehydrogenase
MEETAPVLNVPKPPVFPPVIIRRNSGAVVKFMKAVYFDTKLALKQVPKPKPSLHEALIAVKAVGICNTDLEIIKGYMGFKGILGHEFVGVVKESSDKNLLNKTVVGEINIGCGSCPQCRAGMKRHCPQRTVLGIDHKDGAMAEFLTMPIENLHIIPKTISISEAVFVEPLAAACEILEQVHILPEYRITVIGDGKLAALVAQVLSIVNPHVTVLGMNIHKIRLLRKLGLCAQLEPPQNQSCDIVVECTGNPAGLELALRFIKPRGIIVLKSTYNDLASINQNLVVVNELTLIGSRCGNFPLAINYLHKKLVSVKPLITKIFLLTEYQQAFALAQQPDSLKVILRTCWNVANSIACMV